VLIAFASYRLDVLFVILLAVIIVELLSCLDLPACQDEDALGRDLYLAVRAAGVVDVAGDVRFHGPVYRLLLVHLEEILATTSRRFFLGNLPALVLDDAGSLRDIFLGKEPKPGARAPGTEPVLLYGESRFLFRHRVRAL